MRFDSWTYDPKNPVRLARSVFATVGLAGALSLFWLVSAILATAKVRDLRQSITTNTAAVTEARKSLDDSKKIPQKEPVKSTLAVQTFLGSAQRLAKENQCKVTDAVTGETTAYSSHFNNVGSEGWSCTKVSLSLGGSMDSILKTMKGFNSFGIPYEFIGFETGRTQTDERGNASLAAKIDMLVLVKAAGA